VARTKSTSFRALPQLRSFLIASAKAENITMAELIVRILTEWMEARQAGTAIEARLAASKIEKKEEKELIALPVDVG